MLKYPAIVPFFLLFCSAVRAFVVPWSTEHLFFSPRRSWPKTHRIIPPPPNRKLFASSSPFLNDFKTSKGEVVDPYRVLKIPRDASTPMIKKAYRELSRRYHPDGNRHRTILPGSCNSWEEVRDHWERIRISYEILKSPILRKRYDRHEVMSDPKAAIQRAAVGAAVRGVKSVGRGLFQGLFSAGSFAYEKFTKEMQQPPPAKRSPDDSSSEAVESKSDGTTRVAVEETTVMMAATSDGSSSPIPGLAP